jgi:DNA topoisomerase I
MVRQILELPGHRLFRYIDDDGKVRDVTASSVNAYLRRIAGERYTSKDLRTFGGTVRAATILADIGPVEKPGEAHRNVVLCCRLVASELGNTPAVARSAYIHPAVLGQYEAKGRTIEPLMRKEPRPVEAEEAPAYYEEEAALMRFLERYG